MAILDSAVVADDGVSLWWAAYTAEYCSSLILTTDEICSSLWKHIYNGYWTENIVRVVNQALKTILAAQSNFKGPLQEKKINMLHMKRSLTL